MKHSPWLVFCLTVLCALPLLLPSSAVAASAETTGAITGRVRNVATGQYLNRARVAVRGTETVVFTDEFGTYRLADLRSGAVTLDVFYTDLDPLAVAVDVPAGRGIERDVDLTSVARYGTATNTSGVVRLDAFRVASQKETDAQAIATNEQRFAPNIKNVIATDAFGEVFANSAGDFLKFLPGLAADYDNAEVSTISVRGMGGDKTAVLFDGAPIVTGANTGPTRSVEMRTQSLNNVTRVDVTKVPTPATPADTLAGSINMISKNAFERTGAEFRYGVNLSATSNTLRLSRTPTSYKDERVYKVKPGFDFDYTQPLGKNFGFVLTGVFNQKFNEQNISRKTWNAAGTSTGASFANPYLQQFLIQDSPRYTNRSIYSVKADWRITPNSVLTFGSRYGKNTRASTGHTTYTPSAGTIGTSATAGGTALSYGPDFTLGATGRGALTITGGWQYSVDYTTGSNLGYRYDDGRWRIEANTNYSHSKTLLPSTTRGHFNNVTAVNRNPVRVNFRGIGDERPDSIEVFDANNRAVDPLDPANYRVSAATHDDRKHLLSSRYGNADIRRRLDIAPFPLALQTGGMHRIQNVDARRESATFTYTGANPDVQPFLYDVYKNQELFKGFRDIIGINAGKAWNANLANPTLFTQTPAQVVAAENARLNTSQFAEETVSAGYLQAEARLFKGRLNILGGFRYEHTGVTGEGLLNDPNAVFVRNADGSFARNAQGARIRRPEAGAAGSLEETRLTRKERAYNASRTYDGWYPSLHLTHSLQENLQVRLAWARTYGRPNFPDIIPGATILEADLTSGQLNDPNVVKGNITVTNTGLKPWTADNYDLSLEYYTPTGGMFSAGVFLKEISNFFADSVTLATAADVAALDLDPRYIGWNLATTINSGNARVSGFEFNVRHSLRPLGEWGRYFTVFANATKLKLEGSSTASFTSFVPETANAGLQFTWRRFTFAPRVNYRGLNKLTPQPAFGTDGYLYIRKRLMVDVSLSYQLSSRFSLVGSIGNVFNDELTQLIYGSATPGYARRALNSEYGSAISIGLKGRF
ncbi:TonB-dependent receptor [Horticoccus sp. 23ND18S-11]|uniref:TonB-dependent receptor n=1 Tax=Horticoccus sp. 23ND18S-11 TaxID=3391832 RepID=UPI0039C9EFEA